MRPGRCSNRAVYTLKAEKCRFLHQRAAGATKDKERENSTVHREKERNVDGHASDPHSSIRVTAASLVTEEHPPSFSHKIAPVQQKRARRSCRYFLYRFCAV
ncbi:hypothetical protein QQF64_012258 [Cirrhinus molitorella]|uniref:Uncharacterized protein n=2 Tax=Cirrhinus molitorella TaxID=172907 RepID=A0ABR3LZ17_9TELE|nr:hypothetical protein Q8A67_012022 [Cirrhinus molitorella]